MTMLGQGMRAVRFFGLILVSMALLMATAAAQQAWEPVRVAAEWQMRDTGGMVEDVSGNQHHGELVGESAFAGDATQPDAIVITGSTGAMWVGHSVDLEPARGGVETWINAAYLRDADLFNKLTFRTLRTGLVGGKAVYGVHLFADGTLAGYILNDNEQTGKLWTWVWAPRPVINAGQWHHIVLQWDGTQVGLYVDGIHVAKKPYKEIPGAGLSYSGESEFTLGQATRWFGTGDHQFIGRLGRTRVYNGSMSADEIRVRAARL